MLQALVIDDDFQVVRFVAQILRNDGWEVIEASSAEKALELLPQRDWLIVFCDVILGGADGFSVLKHFKTELPQTKVVLMTGQGSAVGALDATAFGAYDYLLKPFGVDEIRILAATVREQSPTEARRRGLRSRARGRHKSDIHLIGCSQVFIEVMKQVGRLAATDLSVLITGESGTGKEVVASALHCRSKRASGPFVPINCGAVPSELIESELFGHSKGSFTGADRDRVGIWEKADTGTLFLDEITETTIAFQVKLLRALQEGEIRRVGSNTMREVNVRVIAASNKDVEQEIKAGRFRQDLFYRLNAASIVLPPLRARPEDILPLAKSFADQIYVLNQPIVFAAQTLTLLERYSWPGNVRELENAVVRAAAMSYGIIRPEHLPKHIANYDSHEQPAKLTAVGSPEDTTRDQWTSLATVEASYVGRVLVYTRGNKQRAANLLGIDRKTLDRMIKRHNIDLVQTERRLVD